MSSSSTRRRRLPAAEARARILDAAEARLASGGPEAIRLQDIAADLEISHPTILHHFGSRQGLVDALEERGMVRLRDELLAHPDADAGTALEQVLATLAGGGHARLLAWRVLREGDSPIHEEAEMMKIIADAFHASRRNAFERAGEAPPSYEDTAFWLRLSALAMFGEALIGPMLTRSGRLGDPQEVGERFRRWFGALIDRQDPPAAADEVSDPD